MREELLGGEPVPEEEWPYEEKALRVVPLPGGCLVTSTPGGRF